MKCMNFSSKRTRSSSKVRHNLTSSRGERKRHDNSFVDFKNFISNMKIGKVKFRGEVYTWANNGGGEFHAGEVG